MCFHICPGCFGCKQRHQSVHGLQGQGMDTDSAPLVAPVEFNLLPDYRAVIKIQTKKCWWGGSFSFSGCGDVAGAPENPIKLINSVLLWWEKIRNSSSIKYFSRKLKIQLVWLVHVLKKEQAPGQGETTSSCTKGRLGWISGAISSPKAGKGFPRSHQPWGCLGWQQSHQYFLWLKISRTHPGEKCCPDEQGDVKVLVGGAGQSSRSAKGRFPSAQPWFPRVEQKMDGCRDFLTETHPEIPTATGTWRKIKSKDNNCA